MAYIGNWIINANRTSDTIKEFEEVEAYLFSKTALFGLEEHSDDEEPFYPSGDFESGEVREYIDNYKTETFWEELAEELAKKQMIVHYSEEDLKNMDLFKRINLLLSIEDEIKIEFEKNCLKNLTFNPK